MEILVYSIIFNWNSLISIHCKYFRQDDKVTTNLQTLQYNGCHYRFSVKTIDLDTKSFDKMPFYKDQDEEILTHYKEIIKEEGGNFRKCIEG